MALEPIEEKDISLESKFGHISDKKTVENAPASAIENPVARETVAAEKDSAYQQILSKVQGQSGPGSQGGNVSDDAQRVSEKTDAESQIKHLVEIATVSGVVHAVKVAQHLENNYILDTFHDRLLSQELRDELLKKGLIQEL